MKTRKKNRKYEKDMIMDKNGVVGVKHEEFFFEITYKVKKNNEMKIGGSVGE